MMNFNSKCFKCISEQEEKSVKNNITKLLFRKMKESIINDVNNEIFVCNRHKE